MSGRASADYACTAVFVAQEQLRDYYAEAMEDYDAEQLDELLWQHPLAPYTSGDSEVRSGSPL